MSKRTILLVWLGMQIGNLISYFLGVSVETLGANLFFSGTFMLLLMILPKDFE